MKLVRSVKMKINFHFPLAANYIIFKSARKVGIIFFRQKTRKHKNRPAGLFLFKSEILAFFYFNFQNHQFKLKPPQIISVLENKINSCHKKNADKQRVGKILHKGA